LAALVSAAADRERWTGRGKQELTLIDPLRGGNSMAEQDLIKTARGLVDAFNAGDWEACKAALASDSVYDEVGTSRRIQGTAAIIPCLQAWKQAMPDVKGTVSRAVASGNTVVLEVTWAGTQTGSLQGPSGTVPPTGKRQTTRAGWILNFDEGKIKDSRHYFDMLAFLQQLGVIPR
jgi:steroid delta-isomerase-like uncharacterized protein